MRNTYEKVGVPDEVLDPIFNVVFDELYHEACTLALATRGPILCLPSCHFSRMNDLEGCCGIPEPRSSNSPQSTFPV